MRESSQGNITMRPEVYLRGQRRNKPVNVGFDDTNNEVLNSIIQKWPSQLKNQFYSDMGINEISVLYLDEIQEILTVYSEDNDFSDYVSDIENLATVINNMIISKHNLSSETEYASKHKFTPKNEYIPESAGIPISKQDNLLSWLYILVPVVGIIILMYFTYITQSTSKEVSIIKEGSKIEEWEKNIIEMRKKFPSQKEGIWFSIIAGVKTTVTEKPIQPSVFLLLHNDKETSNCLAHSVGKEVTKLLSESAQEPLIIKGEDLKMNKSLSEDYSLFTETYKHDIEKKHVMIILNLQEIPAVIAQAFHILCDVENPLIRDAAFLFTLQIDGNEKQKPTAIAEKHLKALWKDSLDVDIMEPLITRVTNEVLSVTAETDLSC